MIDHCTTVRTHSYNDPNEIVFFSIVIQRHNTSMAKPPSPVSSRMHFSQTSFLSGHEAFSSLVDVASKQPFLPVPTLKDDKRSNVPMISIEQPSEELRYQIAREQIALQTAMQRHHMQQVKIKKNI